ncbi:(d)CMP kinase, partial [Gammaproteobacteria bacterium]|nr:(d)CMP kinase [Gammaproteobacteria bacterium]
MKDNIITIDGPSASGKGSLARNIAAHLNFDILDSGLLYRVYA